MTSLIGSGSSPAEKMETEEAGSEKAKETKEAGSEEAKEGEDSADEEKAKSIKCDE